MNRLGVRLGRSVLPMVLTGAVAAGTAATSLAQAGKGALDGKTFVGEYGDKGKKADGKDELIFKDGRFRSTACDPYKFGDAPYRTILEEDAVRFEAETESPKYGRMRWSGRIQGDVLDGTFVWIKKNNKTRDYWIKATLKP